MTVRKGVCMIATAAALLTPAGQIHAQQDQRNLSAEAVESFFEKAEHDVTRAVQAGDYGSLLDWAKENLADDAAFFVSLALSVGDRRRSIAAVSLDKQDVMRLSRLTAKMMSGEADQQAVQGYSLDIEVVDVRPIGPNAATATTRITERGRFVLAGGTQQTDGGTGDAQQAGADPIEAEATADCSHLIRRGGSGDRLLLGMTACQAEARF